MRKEKKVRRKVKSPELPVMIIEFCKWSSESILGEHWPKLFERRFHRRVCRCRKAFHWSRRWEEERDWRRSCWSPSVRESGFESEWCFRRDSEWLEEERRASEKPLEQTTSRTENDRSFSFAARLEFDCWAGWSKSVSTVGLDLELFVEEWEVFSFQRRASRSKELKCWSWWIVNRSTIDTKLFSRSISTGHCWDWLRNSRRSVRRPDTRERALRPFLVEHSSMYSLVDVEQRRTRKANDRKWPTWSTTRRSFARRTERRSAICKATRLYRSDRETNRLRGEQLRRRAEWWDWPVTRRERERHTDWNEDDVGIKRCNSEDCPGCRRERCQWRDNDSKQARECSMWRWESHRRSSMTCQGRIYSKER